MKKELFLILLIMIMFNGCANQLPPGGGPIDKEPPVVVKTYPASGTLMYNKNFVEFEFSEYINKRNVLSSIFISPYFSDEVELKWSGKKLKIIFPEKLKENKTYIVSLGTDITDLRGNKLSETVSLRFSTGERIDDGIIQGKVFDEKPDGIMIFFYLIDSIGQRIKYDSLRPDFICQTSKDGSFYLPGLPNGIYRIIAVRDKMRNMLFDINEDEIGLPVTDYILNDSLRVLKNVFFEMIKIDTIKPVVNSVKSEDLNHLRINFNEEIDLNSISVENFSIEDYLGINIKVFGFYSVDKNALSIVTEKLTPATDYKIEIRGIKDLSENEIEKTKIDFTTNDLEDTIAINLKKFECNFSTNVMEFFNPACSLYFNDLVRLEVFTSALTVEDTTGNKINYQITRKDSSNFVLKFSELKPKEKILMKINLALMEDLSGNKIDSIITKQIETNSEADYGMISGEIRNKNLVSDLELEAKSVSTKKSYTIKIKEDKYQIKNVLPGSYLLKLSKVSENSDKTLNSFAKPFLYYQDTIKVKSRWPTTDVNFDAKELIR